jgi:aspartyl-tRNA(Asn)/glutamyl-tRNA(Gln) amidotransferase subunit A
VLADPLPTIAELDVAAGPTLQAAMGRVVKYTRPINYLGLPTLTLPVPRGSGLPNGIQLIGRPFAEAQLLAIGQAYQREVPPEIARPLKS